jgi:hypothetical protein
MSLYTGSEDVTRNNAEDITDKEFLDEVRRLTHFSQEDSISLVEVQVPYEFRHLPTEVTLPISCSIFDSMFIPNISYFDLTIFLFLARHPPS